jgi:hypothetical protein
MRDLTAATRWDWQMCVVGSVNICNLCRYAINYKSFQKVQTCSQSIPRRKKLYVLVTFKVILQKHIGALVIKETTKRRRKKRKSFIHLDQRDLDALETLL